MKKNRNRSPQKARPIIRALGRKVTDFKGFDTFPAPKGVSSVKCVSDEVTAVCPVTGQPDWYTVEIVYNPHKLCVESKTLKLYLQSFRNAGHFCENFSAIIAKDLQAALLCPVSVKVTQKPRGGVAIIACTDL